MLIEKNAININEFKLNIFWFLKKFMYYNPDYSIRCNLNTNHFKKIKYKRIKYFLWVFLIIHSFYIHIYVRIYSFYKNILIINDARA